ncbi:class II glutamine amidotransferase [Candidatus Pelagadaptatus aseana]|uniref:class II glutamine amidotransferase n=1 Tax=Candidatus Pelagadaptatus aseana TaxID=3120508 RepID=UPI003C6F61C0
MCELLGMSANVPTDICFSFAGLMQRGGGTGPHRDGWGIAFYEGKGARCFHDPNPSVDSKIANLIKDHPIKSHVVISHIRQANVGDVCLENTHPFQRELWGLIWTYAHNGQLNARLFDKPLRFYQPVGNTDSEYAFCWLLGELRAAFPVRPDDFTPVSEFIHARCEELRELGVFNMLLSESQHLMAYCSTKLAWITRRAPFGEASLSDCDITVDFVKETTPNDVVTVIATEPLTQDETWTRLAPGEMATFVEGLPV